MEILKDMLRAVRLRIRHLMNRSAANQELDEELRFHLEMETRRLVRDGLPPEEARRAALVRFGGVERFREQAREARGTRWVEDGMGDVRYALRMMVKNPLFSLVAIVTLALGIGANTAIFTVVEAVLLEPLPFKDPDRLVALYSENRAENQSRYMTSPMDFDDWRTKNNTFQGMAAYWPTARTLTGSDGNPTRVQAVYTTEDYFDVLGVSALLGRTFTSDDGPGSTEVAILSHGFWERRFGGDRSIVGKSIILDGGPTEVIGVMPEGQRFPADADLWLNMTWPMQIQSRFARWMSAVGRLRSADGLDAARTDMNALASRIAEENPRTNEGWTVRVEPLHDEIVGDTDRALWVLFGATGLVLLIACANVANLLLSRSEARAREIAVRSAFGAGRGRLVRQLLTESVLLSGVGAAAGVALAWVGVRALLGLMPVALPRADTIAMNGTVLLGVVVASVVTGVLFGLAPILRLLASDVRTAMRDGARTTGSSGGHRIQGLFVVGQFALALVVVVGAGLLVRSFANLRAVDPGFRSSGVMTMEMDLPPSVAPSDTAVIEFYDQLRSRVAQLPGVMSVGDASSLPLGTDHDYVQPFQMDVKALPPDVETRAAMRPVSPGFFDVLRTPVLEGRGLEPSDRLDVAGVAVVNEAFVRRFFPDGSPLGSSFIHIGYRFGPLGALNFKDGDAEIVGVVKDVKYDGLRSESQPAIYFSGLQSSIRRRTLLIRTTGAPAGILPAVRRELAALSGQVALTNIRTMEDVVGAARARDRFSTLLLTLFAVVALILASVGVYGVLSYAVAQRRNEMGIRMALGADGSTVRGMVLRDGLRLVATGLLIGVVGALALSGALAGQLFGVSPRDPRVLATVTAVLLLVGLLASFLPALRATRVDPVVAMRTE